MKKILFAISLGIVLIACGKDDDSNALPTTDSFMKASVAGKQLNVSGPGSPTDQKGCTSIFDSSDNTLYLYGNDGIVFINIAIANFPKATGEFALGGIDTERVGNYTDDTDSANPVNYYSTSGKLTVTKYSASAVEGTFEFKAYNSTLKKEVTVTGGEFKVPFTAI